MLKFIIRFSLVSVFVLTGGCVPEQKTIDPLGDGGQVLLSSPDLSVQGLPDIMVPDAAAYPKAVAEGEEAASAAGDSREKVKAHLVLVALHLSRANPNQDFLAASRELDLAVAEDSTLLTQPYIQRWVDVFARLNAMRVGSERAGQLQAENKALAQLLKQKESEVTSLVVTLEELKKLELDVAKKRRLYR